MALLTPECAADAATDQRALFAAIYAAWFTYYGNQGGDTADLPTIECVNAMNQRDILVAIYDVTYALTLL